MLNSATAEVLDFGLSLPIRVPMNILILDDSNFDRLRIRREIQSAGWVADVDEITCLCNLKPRLLEKRYDFVVIDYYLPDGTGEDALDILQRDKLNSDATAVLISGNPWICSSTINSRTRQVHFVAKEELGKGRIFQQILQAAVLH